MRAERETLLHEIKQNLTASDYLFTVDFSGLDVAQTSLFRTDLRSVNARLRVVKNSFLRRAAHDLGWPDISFMTCGPTAMVVGEGDPAVVAQTLVQFLKGKDSAAIKGGCLEGLALSSADVNALARLPSREQMLAIFVGTVAAPMTQLAGVLHSKLCSLLYALKAVEEKKQAAA